MRKLYNTLGVLLMMCAFSVLQAGDMSKPVNQYCVHDLNRNFVVSELAKKYPLQLAYAAEDQMHRMMSSRGLTSLDLLATMWIECRLDHTDVNKWTGAYGIIQFMPRTCVTIGMSYVALQSYGLVTQLQWADVYFRYAESISYHNIVHTEDLYCAILAPARVRMDTLYATGTKAYELNKCLNMQHGDGGLTITDIRKYIYNVVPYRDRLTVLKWSRVTKPLITLDTEIRLDIDPCKYRPTYSPKEFMYLPVVDRT